MKLYHACLTFIMCVKMILVFLIIYCEYLKIKEPKNKQKLAKATYWEERIEFIFKSLMSCLIIYLFNPIFGKPEKMDAETRIMLTIFGYVLLMTADWRSFFSSTKTLVKHRMN